MSGDEWEPYYQPEPGIDETGSLLVVLAFAGLVLWAVIGLGIWWAVTRW